MKLKTWIIWIILLALSLLTLILFKDIFLKKDLYLHAKYPNEIKHYKAREFERDLPVRIGTINCYMRRISLLDDEIRELSPFVCYNPLSKKEETYNVDTIYGYGFNDHNVMVKIRTDENKILFIKLFGDKAKTDQNKKRSGRMFVDAKVRLNKHVLEEDSVDLSGYKWIAFREDNGVWYKFYKVMLNIWFIIFALFVLMSFIKIYKPNTFDIVRWSIIFAYFLAVYFYGKHVDKIFYNDIDKYYIGNTVENESFLPFGIKLFTTQSGTVDFRDQNGNLLYRKNAAERYRHAIYSVEKPKVVNYSFDDNGILIDDENDYIITLSHKDNEIKSDTICGISRSDYPDRVWYGVNDSNDSKPETAHELYYRRFNDLLDLRIIVGLLIMEILIPIIRFIIRKFRKTKQRGDLHS